MGTLGLIPPKGVKTEISTTHLDELSSRLALTCSIFEKQLKKIDSFRNKEKSFKCSFSLKK